MRYSRNGFSGTTVTIVALVLSALMGLQACAHRSVVQVKPPYPRKVRPGDGVKITMLNGTLYSGRVVYVDKVVTVIRTPEQVSTEKPVKSVRFGTTIRWDEVKTVKVAGTLDSQGQLISNEEVRVNRRTNSGLKMVFNVGLLGSFVSFLAATAIQDAISPASTDLTDDNHDTARFWFWTSWGIGTAASAYLGHQYGQYVDWRRSVDRIERQRAAARLGTADSLRTLAKTEMDTIK
jgi:hypothetical protein